MDSKKRIAIVAGIGGLLAAAALVGGSLRGDGGSTAGALVVTTPTATAVKETKQPETKPGNELTAQGNGNETTDTSTGAGNEATQGGGATDSGGGATDSGGGAVEVVDTNAGTDTGSGGNEGQGGSEPEPVDPQEPAPEPQPEPQQEPQPEPQPELEPEVIDEAPTVVSVTPVDEATGIALSSNIVVTFSEPMDKGSVAVGFKLVAPVMAGLISWNADATVMTFNPANDFAYNTTVQWELTGAKDAGGKLMEGDHKGSFKVLRRTTTTLYGQSTFDGMVYAPPVMVDGPHAISGGDTFKVGTWQRGFLSFDLSGLPEDIIKIDDATLSVYQSAHDGGAYGNATGNLLAQSVVYGTLDQTDFSKAVNQFCFPNCVNLESLLSDSAANGWKSADVITPVTIDYNLRDERGDRSQFRLRFQKENGGDGPQVTATFKAGDANSQRPILKLTYIHP